MRILRTDIQVLRAVAVLSVLVFHFDLPGLHKGFLGVDIFFVISGYLMSKVIVEEMDAGRFSAAAFYLRRARRLLPAALAMFGVVTLLAPFALTAHALQDSCLFACFLHSASQSWQAGARPWPWPANRWTIRRQT